MSSNTGSISTRSLPTWRNFPDEVPSSNNIVNDCCKVCISVYLFLLIFMGILGYYIFGIMYLVINSYQDIKDICPDSNVWLFTIISLIIRYPLNITGLKLSNEKYGIEISQLTCIFVINVIFIIFGSIELWLPCSQDKLSNPLYKLLRVDIIGNIILITCFICYLGQNGLNAVRNFSMIR
jgi:hypothetical protein